MTGLPGGWEWAKLNDLQAPEARAITDGPFGSNLASRHYSGEGARVIRLQNIGEGTFRDAPAYIPLSHFATLKNHNVVQGDLLLASLGEDLPRVCLAPNLGGPAIVKSDCIRARLSPHVDSRWVMHALLAPQSKRSVKELIHGVGRPRLGLGAIRELAVPVPPLAEQRRIVDALDDHLSRLDAAEASLKDAVRRREVAKAAVLAQVVAKAGGDRVLLSDLAYDSGYGTSVKCGPDGTGPAVLRIPNVVDGRIDLSNLKYAIDADSDLRSLQLTAGDLLVVRTNGSRDLIGRTAAVTQDLAAAFASYLIRFRLRGELVDPRWVSLILGSRQMRREIEGMAASSAGQYNLNLKKLGSLSITLPTLERQRAALCQASDRTDELDRLGAAVAVAQKRAASLRRSLLDAAFSGRLVPQDPADEPAADLLARTAAERPTSPRKRASSRSASQ